MMTPNTHEHPSQAISRLVSQRRCPLCREEHTTHQTLPTESGFMERVSDLIGSPRGIWLLAAIEAVYMVLATVLRFDPYPFAFLTLVLSLIALQFSQIIIVVQNRQGAVLEGKAAREREQVAADYDLDSRAFALLSALHKHLVPAGAGDSDAAQSTLPEVT